MQAEQEQYLRKVAGKGQEMVQQMVQSLSSALIYPEAGNVATNEKLWDVYASEWGKEAPWVVEMAATNRDEAVALDAVGDEWAPRAHTERVVDEWILSEVAPEARCCEIGSGGGRIAALVAPRVASLACCDVSAKMLARAEAALAGGSGATSFHLVHGDAAPSDAGFGAGPRAYPTAMARGFDFVYCFDVMVHLDAHAMYRCLRRVESLLADGGRAFVSTANLKAPDGFARFEKQSKYSVGGFFFVTPETVRVLADKAGLAVVRELDAPDASNTYYNRDYLAILARKDAA